MTTRRNECTNPACKNDLSNNWGQNGAGAADGLTVTRADLTGLGFSRNTGARVGSTGTGGNYTRTALGAVSPSTSYTVSFDIKADAGFAGSFYIAWQNNAGSDVDFSTIAYSCGTGTTQRITGTGSTTNINAVQAQLIIDGTNRYISDVNFELASTADGTYFDGDSAGGAWTGTNGSSASTLSSGTSYNADATSATSASDSAGANLTRQGAATSTTSASDTAVAARTTYGAASSTTQASDTATALRTTVGSASSSTQTADSAGANLVRPAAATGLTTTADLATASVTSAGGTLFWPTGELVAMAWLRGVAGAPADAVSTNLPRDSSEWAATGFLQVESIGGGPNVDVPVSHVDVRVHCWAVKPKSSKPPWWMANQLAEVVRMGCYGNVDAAAPTARNVVLPDNYLNARVLSVVPLNEPQRVLLDEARFAHYQIDLRFSYTYIPAAS